MKAYPEDLHQKIVDAIERGISKTEAARTFGIGISTVKRYASKARRAESLEPGKAPGNDPRSTRRQESSSKRTSMSVSLSPSDSVATT